MRTKERGPVEDYSAMRDLLETWRSTTDWVKALVVLAVPGTLALIARLVIGPPAPPPLPAPPVDEARLRALVEAEVCHVMAGWVQAPPLDDDTPPALGPPSPPRLL